MLIAAAEPGFGGGAADPLLLRLASAMGAEAATQVSRLVGADRTAAAKRDLMAEGHAAEAVLVLRAGWACRYRLLADGRRQITTVLLPGDTCNPDAVACARSRCGIRTLTPCTVAEIDARRLRALIDAAPIVARGWVALHMLDSAMLTERSVSLGRRSASERVAHLICETWTRLAFTGHATTLTLALPITQEEIGDVLGLTAVHVNRTFSSLRAAGLVEVAKRQLAILDWARLASLAQFDPAYLHASAPAAAARHDGSLPEAWAGAAA